jgi:hypothetical protein
MDRLIPDLYQTPLPILKAACAYVIGCEVAAEFAVCKILNNPLSLDDYLPWVQTLDVFATDEFLIGLVGGSCSTNLSDYCKGWAIAQHHTPTL